MSEPSDIVLRSERLAADSRALLDEQSRARSEVARLHDLARHQAVAATLATLDLDALREATGDRIRLAPLEVAGFRTVAQVATAAPADLDRIDGIGPQSAAQLVAAAQQVRQAVQRATRARLDVESRPPEHTDLLVALRHLDLAGQVVEPLRTGLEWAAATLPAESAAARLATTRLRRLFAGRHRRDESEAALSRLRLHLAAPATVDLEARAAAAMARLADPRWEPADPWDDYLARPVHYNGLLADATGLGPDEVAIQGFAPAEIVAEIERLELDTALLVTSLRGYQSFGARFALVQRRTILGDDMGLGKTLEALAVLCHLRSGGATHFAVVCPASVLANWEHEIRRHTELDRVVRLHGTDRHDDLDRWATGGGIALTTFDTLRLLPPPPLELSAMVVDEAHFAKNPEAQRTRAVRTWLTRAGHRLLLTGTPMENRVDEFRVLVGHVRPDLAEAIDGTDAVAGADAFRRAVAPVYLRRNQADVLAELPPRIEIADWVRLDGPVAGVYRRAVAAGSFMAMRRAAFLTERPEESPKLVRLREIVDEAMANNRKVVVFSFFRDVIDRVCAELGPLAVGPLTGDVAPDERQALVDAFTAAPEPVVLVSQIEAGGVGLNIQAASVVILTEPQWKPTVEEQAIARCHRMGQVRPVEVHRLLAEGSVDERMLAVLATKSALFAEYVRQSEMKEASPEAVDVSDLAAVDDLADGVVGTTEQRIVALERERLGLPTT
ncbi:MAG: SNF2-related protein [Acidimicrobiales bacterium]